MRSRTLQYQSDFEERRRVSIVVTASISLFAAGIILAGLFFVRTLHALVAKIDPEYPYAAYGLAVASSLTGGLFGAIAVFSRKRFAWLGIVTNGSLAVALIGFAIYVITHMRFAPGG